MAQRPRPCAYRNVSEKPHTKDFAGLQFQLPRLRHIIKLVSLEEREGGPMEPEATWLRQRIVRLRAAFRYAMEMSVEAILREVVADMEDRLEHLEAETPQSN